MFGLSFLPAAEACCVDPSSSLLLSGEHLNLSLKNRWIKDERLYQESIAFEMEWTHKLNDVLLEIETRIRFWPTGISVPIDKINKANLFYHLSPAV